MLIRSALFSASLLATTYVSALEALPDQPPTPPDNPMTPAKVQLGMQLFFEPRLSVDGTLSCNSCHNVMANGTDNRPVSIGVRGQKGGRSAPTVWNAAYLSVQFWDGRASSLEEQAKGPVLNPIEMGMPHKELAVNRIASIAGYREQFTSVFGGDKPVSYDNIAKAIASYERTLITPNSPYDQYAKGKEDALSAQAKRGLDLVQSFGCTSCHNGPVFAGPALPEGQGFFQKFPIYPGSQYEVQYGLTKDLGRYEVTKKAEDKSVWRVPTWRNIALTAPYFHNGSVATLDEAVRVMAKTQLNKPISDEDTRSIVAFLESLTGEFPTQQMPRLPDTSGATVLSSVE
jgi:cytochrome c peroxidase